MRERLLGGIGALVAAAALFGSAGGTAEGKAAPAPKTCIRVSHRGSQDRPLGSVKMCVGKKGKKTLESAIENHWRFEFDATSFEHLRAFVNTQKEQPPLDAGILPTGTLGVTWPAPAGEEEYVVPATAGCAYLDGLVQAVPVKDYAEFVQGVSDFAARLHCPASKTK